MSDDKFRTQTGTGFGADRFHFSFPEHVGQNDPTGVMEISRGANETSGAFAARLSELRGIIDSMVACRDDTAFTALDTRRQTLGSA